MPKHPTRLVSYKMADGNNLLVPSRSAGMNAYWANDGVAKAAVSGFVRAQDVDGTVIRAASDSGMVTAFRPAQYIKGAQAGLIQRLTTAFLKSQGFVEAELTTEQGAAGAASPSTAQLMLYQQRYDRRSKIAEARQMFIDDNRANRACWMYAQEAVRGGVNITVAKPGAKKVKGKIVNPADGTGARGPMGRRNQIATEVAQDVKRIMDPKVASWACMLIVEGDLFVQAVVASVGVTTLTGTDLAINSPAFLAADAAARAAGPISGQRLVNGKRMPAASMERNTDDADEFVDVYQAFSQVDVSTDTEVATFPLALVHHGRWNHIDGERYGESTLVTGRRKRRLLELQEEAQAVRRLTRAVKRNLWSLGDPKNGVAGKATDIKDFREENGMVEGKRDIFDPQNLAIDYFGNGMVNVQAIDSDNTVADIDDLKYQQNVYTSATLPTPGVLFNLDAESVNRDVVKDVRGEWLKQTITLSDAMTEVARFLFETGCLVRGVLPSTVDYSIHFSESSMETPSEIVDRVMSLRKNIIGLGPSAMPDPLISKRRALQLIADIVDIEDVDAELAQIEEELEVNRGVMAEQKQQDFELQMQHASTLSARTGGNSTGVNGATTQGNPPPGSGGGAKPQGLPHTPAQGGAGKNPATAPRKPAPRVSSAHRSQSE